MLLLRKTLGAFGIALLLAAALWLRYTSFTERQFAIGIVTALVGAALSLLVGRPFGTKE
jgi:ABC-type Fe3+-siderophore transport system permease subunit